MAIAGAHPEAEQGCESQTCATFYTAKSEVALFWSQVPAPPGSGLNLPGEAAARSRSGNDDQSLRGPLVFACGLVFPCYQGCRGVWRAPRGAWWRFKISATLAYIPDTMLHKSETCLRNQPTCTFSEGLICTCTKSHVQKISTNVQNHVQNSALVRTFFHDICTS